MGCGASLAGQLGHDSPLDEEQSAQMQASADARAEGLERDLDEHLHQCTEDHGPGWSEKDIRKAADAYKKANKAQMRALKEDIISALHAEFDVAVQERVADMPEAAQAGAARLMADVYDAAADKAIADAIEGCTSRHNGLLQGAMDMDG